jgi:hypothetical protein
MLLVFAISRQQSCLTKALKALVGITQRGPIPQDAVTPSRLLLLLQLQCLRMCPPPRRWVIEKMQFSALIVGLVGD